MLIQFHQVFQAVNLIEFQIGDIYLQFQIELFPFHMSCNKLYYGLIY